MKDRKANNKRQLSSISSVRCNCTYGGVSFSVFFEWDLVYEHMIVGGVVTLVKWSWEANNLDVWRILFRFSLY